MLAGVEGEPPCFLVVFGWSGVVIAEKFSDPVILVERAGFCWYLWSVLIGVAGSVISPISNLGYERQKDDPGILPSCHCLDLMFPNQAAFFQRRFIPVCVMPSVFGCTW